MTESERIKSELAGLLSNMEASNVDMVADAIEALIDIRLAELLDQLSERLETIRRK